MPGTISPKWVAQNEPKYPQTTDFVQYELKYYQPDGSLSHVEEPHIKIGNDILGMTYLTEHPSDSDPRSTFTQFQKE